VKNPDSLRKSWYSWYLLELYLIFPYDDEDDS